VSDDPNSIAAIAACIPYGTADRAEGFVVHLAEYGFEVVPAGTADRLAVAEAAHLATYETVSRRADAAEARLAALLDAIGDPDELADLTTLHPAWAHVELLRRIAAAVQPPDCEQLRRLAYEQHRAISSLRRMFGMGTEWDGTGAEALWQFGESDEGWALICGDRGHGHGSGYGDGYGYGFGL
jgi:hypothetical protein